MGHSVGWKLHAAMCGRQLVTQGSCLRDGGAFRGAAASGICGSGWSNFRVFPQFLTGDGRAHRLGRGQRDGKGLDGKKEKIRHDANGKQRNRDDDGVFQIRSHTLHFATRSQQKQQIRSFELCKGRQPCSFGLCGLQIASR